MGFANPIRVITRDMRARKELALLVWVAVNLVVEKICSNAAVVEQGVALSWSSIPNYCLSRAIGFDQELEQAALHFLDLFGEEVFSVGGSWTPECNQLRDTLGSKGVYRSFRTDSSLVTPRPGSAPCSS